MRLTPDPVEQGRVPALDALDGPVDPGGDAVLPVLLLGDGQSGHGRDPPRDGDGTGWESIPGRRARPAQASAAALSWSMNFEASAGERSSGRSTPCSSRSSPARSACWARAM